MTRKIEFLLAHDNGTWTTEVMDVPEDSDAMEWVNADVAPLSTYRKVVLFAVYSEIPDERQIAREECKS